MWSGIYVQGNVDREMLTNAGIGLGAIFRDILLGE